MHLKLQFSGNVMIQASSFPRPPKTVSKTKVTFMSEQCKKEDFRFERNDKKTCNFYKDDDLHRNQNGTMLLLKCKKWQGEALTWGPVIKASDAG